MPIPTGKAFDYTNARLDAIRAFYIALLDAKIKGIKGETTFLVPYKSLTDDAPGGVLKHIYYNIIADKIFFDDFHATLESQDDVLVRYLTQNTDYVRASGAADVKRTYEETTDKENFHYVIKLK